MRLQGLWFSLHAASALSLNVPACQMSNVWYNTPPLWQRAQRVWMIFRQWRGQWRMLVCQSGVSSIPFVLCCSSSYDFLLGVRRLVFKGSRDALELNWALELLVKHVIICCHKSDKHELNRKWADTEDSTGCKFVLFRSQENKRQTTGKDK